MAWIGDEIKDDIYKDLYFNSEDKYFNAGMLNLVNLADRDEQQRKAIARKGNAESIKRRRINKGIKLYRRFKEFKKMYADDPATIKCTDGRILTKKETSHLATLNKRYDRLQRECLQMKEQLKGLYGIDVKEEIRKQESLENIYNFQQVKGEYLEGILKNYLLLKKIRIWKNSRTLNAFK